MPSPAAPTIDQAHDVLRSERQPLEAIFAPGSVAVIGASEKPGSVGRTILWNLITNPFGGPVYPVNPKRSHVLGIKAYPSLAALPERADLAVIVTPAATVPDVIAECVAAGVAGAIVISAGFKEVGPEGAELERRVKEAASKGPLRIIGPNCLGVMRPDRGLNATFASRMAHPGSLGFLSQSGALCTAILDWSLSQNVGFSAFVSIGSMLDVDWGDLIDYLGNDPATKAIIMYMETIGDTRSFLSAAREVAGTKPIIVIKPGRTEAAARAAASHTGSLAGRDDVLDAAFHRVGVLRVQTIAEVFNLAEALGKQPRPRGPRLSIVTNAGGPAVLATDALITSGGALAPLPPETVSALDAVLPPSWSRGNPIDVLGDADASRYARALEAALKDPESDGTLVILTPQAMTEATKTADLLKVHARGTGKPLLACWMGATEVAAGEALLNQAGIPTFVYPDTAARMFALMWRYQESFRALYETPTLADENGGPDRAAAAAILEAARGRGRGDEPVILTEFESKSLLSSYGIPIVPTAIAATADEAVAEADGFGYPVVLKLHSETITHKTDVGGVQLNLRNADAVRSAFEAIRASVAEKAGAEHIQGVTVQPMIPPTDGYELILGSSLDDQFGPVLLVGTGGQLVEVYQDRALGLPPLTTTLARRMLERTKIFNALKGVRGRPPVDLVALERLMVRFSQLVVEQPAIREIDINPLLVSHERMIALDARVILHGPAVADDDLPRAAIRPYPLAFRGDWTARDGTRVTIRPIRPEDEPLLVRFHQNLSDRSVMLRYFHAFKLSQRVAHERLVRICFIDYDREMALVVEHRGPGGPEILGVGRLSKVPGTDEAEFAILIRDEYQSRGLGSELLRRLIEFGRGERLGRITAQILPENKEMQRLCARLGFRLDQDPGEDLVRATLELA